MKQVNLFGAEFAPEDSKLYTKKIKAPIYEPKNKCPHLLELYDYQKTNEIKNSEVTEDEKIFLIEAAKRHTVFNYEKIANYYSHASPEMQRLMERSALIIIDFEKAIEYGYVQLCEEIRSQYLEEYNND
jgi:hypothetical protein